MFSWAIYAPLWDRVGIVVGNCCELVKFILGINLRPPLNLFWTSTAQYQATTSADNWVSGWRLDELWGHAWGRVGLILCCVGKLWDLARYIISISVDSMPRLIAIDTHPYSRLE